MPNLRTLKIQSNDITELEPGRVSNVPNLQYLHLQRSKIAKLAYETPLCPENCTTTPTTTPTTTCACPVPRTPTGTVLVLWIARLLMCCYQ